MRTMEFSQGINSEGKMWAVIGNDIDSCQYPINEFGEITEGEFSGLPVWAAWMLKLKPEGMTDLFEDVSDILGNFYVLEITEDNPLPVGPWPNNYKVIAVSAIGDSFNALAFDSIEAWDKAKVVFHQAIDTTNLLTKKTEQVESEHGH